MTDDSRSICFLVTSHVTATNFLRGYVSSLRERGWQVAVICSPGKGLEAWARQQGVNVHTIPMRREPSPFRDLRSLFALVSLLLRLRPDVLVYATPKASLLGAMAGAIAGIKARVYELWGLRLETARGVRWHVLRATELVTVRLSTSVVANSQSLARRTVALGITRTKPVVLGGGSSHGVDCAYYRRDADYPDVDDATREFMSSTSGFTVGFVGRLHPDKGVDTLLEALSDCARLGIQTRALLVGPDEGAGLEDVYLELEDRVPIHRTGSVDDTRPYLAAMDVLVLMSLREGFPNVVLEAAGMELAAVVADSTGTVDSVVDGVTGRVVATGDAIALGEVLRELQHDRERLKLLGLSARKHAISRFDQPTVWGLHADFFDRARQRADRG